MIAEICARAYAKINFGLEVFPKSQDIYGCKFHNIQGIFQTINLYDELVVRWNPELQENSKGECKISCEEMEFPENNTLTSAYQAFCEVLEMTDLSVKVPSILVQIKKNIPAGGGLGGGSSDAATLIRMLEKICGVSLSLEQLDLIASKVGCDVFFFLHCDQEGRACALVSGRGEKIEKIRPRNDLFLLLLFPKQASSTKIAYKLVDEAFLEGEKITCPDYSELESIYNSPVTDWSFKNTFTSVIAKSLNEVEQGLEALRKNGCCFAEMSGSGSTVYGVFTSKQQGDAVCSLLAETWNCKLVSIF